MTVNMSRYKIATTKQKTFLVKQKLIEQIMDTDENNIVYDV